MMDGSRAAWRQPRRLHERSRTDRSKWRRSPTSARSHSPAMSARRQEPPRSRGRNELKTSLVATIAPGFARIIGSRGSSRGLERISPMPRITRGRGSRQTGTSAPVARAACMRRGSSSGRRFVRASSRSAAAASLDPPPSPAATGSRFESTKRPSLRPATRSASAWAAFRTRLSAIAPDAAAVGPPTASSSLGPGVRLKASATPAKATRLSISWYPSVRRPTTRRVRLIFAGAKSTSAADTITRRRGLSSCALRRQPMRRRPEDRI